MVSFEGMTQFVLTKLNILKEKGSQNNHVAQNDKIINWKKKQIYCLKTMIK